MKTYYIHIAFIIIALFLSACSLNPPYIVPMETTQATGVSNGTLNATSSPFKHLSTAKNNIEQAITFAQINWMNLSENMSKGEGEYLMAMARLLKVTEQQKAVFYVMTQKKFTTLFNSTKTTATQLVHRLQLEITKL